MSEIEQLQKAIAALEGQRALLGEVVEEAALAPIREKLWHLQAEAGHQPEETAGEAYDPWASAHDSGRGIPSVMRIVIKNRTVMRRAAWLKTPIISASDEPFGILDLLPGAGGGQGSHFYVVGHAIP